MTAPASGAPRRPRKPPRLIGDLLTLVLVVGLLGTVYLLPPDTSLAEVRRIGQLRVCMPSSYPPLVTGDTEAPGFDVELLREVARRLDVDFRVSINPAIGADFNPRNWRINRAQCQVIAGGVVMSRDVQSFLDTVPSPLGTGWAVVSKGDFSSIEEATLGVYASLTGLDRIGLGRALRAAGARAKIVQSLDALEAGLRSGEFDAGVTEALMARQLAGANGWTAQWLPQPIERYALGFGIWRGDLTLLRAIKSSLEDLEREGFIHRLLEKYKIAPISGTLAEPV